MSNIMNQILHISLVSSGIIIVLLVVNYFLTRNIHLSVCRCFGCLLLFVCCHQVIFSIEISVPQKVQDVGNVLVEEQEQISDTMR